MIILDLRHFYSCQKYCFLQFEKDANPLFHDSQRYIENI